MTKKFALALVSLMVLAFITVGSASAAAFGTHIEPGETVFIGESGLNIAGVLVDTKLVWYSPGSTVGSEEPARVFTVNNNGTFYVSPDMFTGYTGAWYSGSYNTTAAFYVEEPSFSVKIYETTNEKDVTGKKLVADDTVTFRIDSNLQSLFARGAESAAQNTVGVDFNVITPDGATLTGLVNSTSGVTTITGIQPNDQQYYLLNDNVSADIWKLDISKYSPGTYEVIAKINVNGMKDNLGQITGKTVSATQTLEIDKDTVSITADKETVVRNNDFAVTIDGKPSTTYYVWFSGTNSYSEGNGTSDLITVDLPPFFMPNQDDVRYMNDSTTYIVDNIDLNYTYKGTNTKISSNVARTDLTQNYADTTTTNNPYAVNVTTGTDGKITIGIETHSNTKAATYTIRAQKAGDQQLYDTVKVKVEKGAVTITASGDGAYYLGQQITFSGTNTDSDYVYLFIDGPNLYTNGAKLNDPTNTKTVSGDTNTFVVESVKTDNTWEYKLETATIGLDAGSYTVYAVNEPKDKGDLSGTKYDTVSISVKTPYVTATVSSSTVAKGDKLYIRGTAEGSPTEGVAIWILGTNYWNGAGEQKYQTETVNDDGSFEYEFGSGDTKDLSPGQYFVVVQHPMYNDVFDVSTAVDGDAVLVEERSDGKLNAQFVIWGGSNKLQGSNAAEALIEMIDSADIDDTYTKLTFLIQEPMIKINAIGDHYVGDQFTISGTTNLAVDDDVKVDIKSSSFTATKKSQSGEFSGDSDTVKVVEGETYNEWSMDVDASTFKPDEYIVNVESIETSATQTTTFNILSGPGPSETVTATETSATATVTTTGTQVTPTKTAAPGFGALVALIGLGAVAALVLRKE